MTNPIDELLPVIERVGRFVEMMTEKPLKLADDFYAIHVGTEWEAELRLSDLRALVDAWNTRIASKSVGVTEGKPEGADDCPECGGVGWTL